MTIADLMGYLKNREFSLFLGAGASVSGGGPTSGDLLDAIKAKYPIVENEQNFFALFDKILKNEKERPAIEKIIRDILVNVEPTDDSRYLLSLPWKAVLTTNYDRIPELVDTTLDGIRTIDTQVNDMPSVDIRKEEHLYCFKLFGDMSVSYPQEGYMVLTNSDRRRAFTRQANFFSLFKDLAKSGIVVYLGYSFGDELVFDLMEDMLFQERTFPHRGFAIIPSKPTDEALEQMKDYHIDWVQGSLKDFVLECKRTFGDRPQSCSVSLNPIKIQGKMIELERSTISNMRGQVKVVNQAFYTSDYDKPHMFLEGKDHSFVPFQRDWDFPRNWKVGCLTKRAKADNLVNIKTLVESRSKTGNPNDNIILALLGRAGSGKSILAKRIAHEWYTSGKNPVLFIDPSSNFIDSTAIASFLDEIWNKYRKRISGHEKVADIRYLLVLDNGSYLLSQIRQLANDLTSAGKPVDILLVDRLSELPPDKLKEIQADATLEIMDTINQAEGKQFIEHFERLNILPDTSALKYNLMNREINTSFFALMYTSIREVQIPLKDIIIREFKGKNDEAKRVYATVSLIQAYGLSAYESIARKACGLDYGTIASMIDSGPLIGVLSFNEENQSLEATHRIVADIIKSIMFSTPDLLSGGMTKLFSVVSEGNVAEMGLVHSLLIHSQSIRDELPPQKLEPIFNAVIKKIKTRPLYLHLAKLQRRLEKYDECRASLDAAKRVQHPNFPEPLNHIHDAEGRLELSLARECADSEDPNKKSQEWQHLEHAEGAFTQARHSPLSSPHPFHGLAVTYRNMAKLQTKKEQAVNLLLLALDNIQELNNNSSDWFALGKSRKLEVSIYQLMADLGFTEADAQAVFERNNNANGFAFLADFKIGTNDKEALRLVDEGLKRDSFSLWLIRQKVLLLKKNFADDIDELYDTLMEYRIGSKFDLKLAFELAKIQFIRGEWDNSDQTFKDLRLKSKGYRNRLLPSAKDRWQENGKAKVFRGILEKAPTIEEWGVLRSNDPPIPRPIPVENRFMNYERFSRGDKVTFEIIFNMVGPQGSEVKLR